MSRSTCPGLKCNQLFLSCHESWCMAQFFEHRKWGRGSGKWLKGLTVHQNLYPRVCFPFKGEVILTGDDHDETQTMLLHAHASLHPRHFCTTAKRKIGNRMVRENQPQTRLCILHTLMSMLMFMKQQTKKKHLQVEIEWLTQLEEGPSVARDLEKGSRGVPYCQHRVLLLLGQGGSAGEDSLREMKTLAFCLCQEALVCSATVM